MSTASATLVAARQAMPVPARVVLFAAKKDVRAGRELATQLAPLLQAGHISLWHPDLVSEGEDVAATSSSKVQEADLILLLVSADFFVDPLALAVLEQALARMEQGVAVYSVLFSAADIHNSPATRTRILPANRRPVRNWRQQADAWQSVVRGLIDEIARITGRPIATPRSRPTQWTRIGAAALAACLALGVAVAVGLPTLQLPQQGALPDGVILLAQGPRPPRAWEQICMLLKRHGAEHVHCARSSWLYGTATARGRAAISGAALLVLVIDEERLQMWPLQGTSHLPLAADDFRDKVVSVASPDAAVTRIEIVRRLFGGHGGRCQGVVPDDPQLGPEFRQWSLLLRWMCDDGFSIQNSDLALLRSLEVSLCEDKTETDSRCALCRYLLGLAEGGTAGRLLAVADKAHIPRLRQMAALEYARRTCAVAPEQTVRKILSLHQEMAKSPACDRLPLAAIIPCAPREGLPPSLQQDIAAAEGTLLRLVPACPPWQLGRIFHERGHHLLVQREFQRARFELMQAQHWAPAPDRLLLLAEAVLLSGDQRGTAHVLDLSPLMKPAQQIQGAYLQWLATPTAETSMQLITRYEALQNGQVAIRDITGALRERACSDAQRCQAHALLSAPKGDYSVVLLRNLKLESRK